MPQLPHFNIPEVDEKNALVMNVVLPPEASKGPHPIFVYVHGGSLLWGGSYLAIFDSVRLVSQSIEEGRPIIAINFNYRVGLGGFLASAAIEADLVRHGFQGRGNFGLTDQQVAFDWVQHFGTALGGDIENVTACGESAGGVSVSNQLLAKKPPIFHRAICMSGLAYSIPAWTMEQHEELFTMVCKWFGLNPEANGITEQLRNIPEQELAQASLHMGLQTGDPCIDGVFHEQSPFEFQAAPKWLKSYMVGDVYHEAIIFRLNIMNDCLDLWREVFLKYIEDETTVDQIFQLYELFPNLPQQLLVDRFEFMAGDAIFRLPNYLTAIQNSKLSSQNKLFLYHFDQRSTIKNSLEGTAYHAHELLYLFKNLKDEMTEEQRFMAKDFASAWIKFAHGEDPWPVPASGHSQRYWKIWGDHGKQAVVTEAEDEEIRRYLRLDAMLNIGEPGVTWHKWYQAIDQIVNKRWKVGENSSHQM